MSDDFFQNNGTPEQKMPDLQSSDTEAAAAESANEHPVYSRPEPSEYSQPQQIGQQQNGYGQPQQGSQQMYTYGQQPNGQPQQDYSQQQYTYSQQPYGQPQQQYVYGQLPSDQPPQDNQQQYVYGQQPGDQPQQDRDSVGFGVASLVLGILSVLLFCLCCVNFFTALLAIIFGIVQIVKSKHKGMAIAGIITAAISVILSIFLWSGAFANLRALGDVDVYNEWLEDYYDRFGNYYNYDGIKEELPDYDFDHYF